MDNKNRRINKQETELRNARRRITKMEEHLTRLRMENAELSKHLMETLEILNQFKTHEKTLNDLETNTKEIVEELEKTLSYLTSELVKQIVENGKLKEKIDESSNSIEAPTRDTEEEAEAYSEISYSEIEAERDLSS